MRLLAWSAGEPSSVVAELAMMRPPNRSPPGSSNSTIACAYVLPHGSTHVRLR